MKNLKTTLLDPNQIVSKCFDEDNDAQRVICINPVGFGSINNQVVEKNIFIKEQQIVEIEKPIIITEYKEIQIPVIVKEVEYKILEIEKPIIIYEPKIVEVEKTIVVKEIQIKEIEKPVYIYQSQTQTKFHYYLLAVQTLSLIALIVKLFKS